MKRFARIALIVVAPLVAFAACKGNPAAMHRDKGYEYADKGDWKQAASEFGQSLNLDPKQETIWEQKAYAHIQLKEYDEAEAAMVKFAEFKSDAAKKAKVLNNVGGMYVQAGDSQKAEKMFLKALAVNPSDDEALTWLGELYSQRGGARMPPGPPDPSALQKAIEYYDKLVAVKPDLPNTYINERIALVKLAEYEQSQKDAALKDAFATKKDPAKKQELQAAADAHQTRIDQLKKQIDEVTHKFADAQKLAQASQDK
jgi:tetratricopeptide (TPR) repeat protein